MTIWMEQLYLVSIWIFLLMAKNDIPHSLHSNVSDEC